MSDTAVITPPVQAPTNAGSDGGLQAAMKAQMEYNQSQQAPTQEVQKPTQDTPKTETEAQTQKTHENAPESQQTDKKRPWDKLKSEEPAEQAKLETTEGADEYPDDAPKAQNAWTSIKKRVKELEALQKTWENERSTWNTEKTQWETHRKQLEEKANSWSEDQLKEYQKLKEREAIEYVEQSEAYQKEAQAPWDRGNAALKEISDYSQVDAKAIREVLMEPNKLTRHDKLVELLGSSPKSLSEARIEILAKEAMDAGDDLIKAAEAYGRLTKDAAIKREQVAQQEKAAALKAQEEAKKVLRDAISEVDSGLRVQLKDLLDDGILSEKDLGGGGEDFDMQQDPMDLAFGTRSAHLLPAMAKALRNARREIAQLKEDQKARQAARPGLKPNGATNGSKPVPSLKEAMRAHTQWVPGS